MRYYSGAFAMANRVARAEDVEKRTTSAERRRKKRVNRGHGKDGALFSDRGCVAAYAVGWL